MSTMSDHLKCPQCEVEENATYFSSDLTRFVCGNCARDCKLSDYTRVVYGTFQSHSAPTNVKLNGCPAKPPKRAYSRSSQIYSTLDQIAFAVV